MILPVQSLRHCTIRSVLGSQHRPLTRQRILISSRASGIRSTLVGWSSLPGAHSVRAGWDSEHSNSLTWMGVLTSSSTTGSMAVNLSSVLATRTRTPIRQRGRWSSRARWSSRPSPSPRQESSSKTSRSSWRSRSNRRSMLATMLYLLDSKGPLPICLASRSLSVLGMSSILPRQWSIRRSSSTKSTMARSTISRWSMTGPRN